MRRALSVALTIAQLSACADPSTPTATQPALIVDLGVEVQRAPDPMSQFFGSEAHARISDGAGWSAEWIAPEGSSSTRVPSGTLQLELWTVVHGDTLECATDPVTAQESCFQPIIGTGQVCSLTVDLAAETRASVRFLILSQERCELTGDAG